MPTPAPTPTLPTMPSADELAAMAAAAQAAAQATPAPAPAPSAQAILAAHLAELLGDHPAPPAPVRWGLLHQGIILNVVLQPEKPAPETAIPAGDWVECGPAGPGWVQDGAGVFVPPPPPPPARVERVTMRQARLALLAAGKLAAVDAAIAALPAQQKAAAQIEWEYSSMVERAGALINAMAPALGLSSADLDALFTAAAAL